MRALEFAFAPAFVLAATLAFVLATTFAFVPIRLPFQWLTVAVQAHLALGCGAVLKRVVGGRVLLASGDAHGALLLPPYHATYAGRGHWRACTASAGSGGAGWRRDLGACILQLLHVVVQRDVRGFANQFVFREEERKLYCVRGQETLLR